MTDTLGLSALFGSAKSNPYDRRAKTTAAMMEHSGFAKPFLAIALGQDMAQAQEWDEKRENEGLAAQQQLLKQQATKADMEFAQKVIGSVIDVSKNDPVAATEMLNRAVATGNPLLKSYEGIKFNAKTDKD